MSPYWFLSRRPPALVHPRIPTPSLLYILLMVRPLLLALILGVLGVQAALACLAQVRAPYLAPSPVQFRLTAHRLLLASIPEALAGPAVLAFPAQVLARSPAQLMATILPVISLPAQPPTCPLTGLSPFLQASHSPCLCRDFSGIPATRSSPTCQRYPGSAIMPVTAPSTAQFRSINHLYLSFSMSRPASERL